WSEPADLFTKLAPPEYRDRVPHVEEVEGRPMWVFNGHPVGVFSAAGVIGRDGKKESADIALNHWEFEKIHVGAYDPKVRLEVMDDSGIDAQVIFPSTIGLGGQHLAQAADAELSLLAIHLYNDAQAEIQAESNERLLPLPLMPAWDVDASVVEAERVAAMGARGVNMTSDPQDLGAPDLASTEWDPFWEVCTELQLPVHFHIGASVTAETFRGKYHWPSQALNTQLALSGTLLFVGNARVVANAIVSGVFDRHPDLKMVSVESGVGWIPFILEALDYEMAENAPDEFAKLKKLPSEYFRSNLYATFWFENNRNKLPELIEAVGEDSILFETDFPHPTCLYPKPLDTIAAKMATLPPETQRKIYGENARKLYRL
ncbi:MAG TPA: amidohydrolase family protein, partial [Acidimicrobiia bacterium]|nr:amidohydrolase family protein [Acidimicrobiia bacterium]